MASLLLCALLSQSVVTLKPGLVKPKSTSLLSATIVVPDNYTTIQQAINAANQGDTVHVRGRTYHENLFINKTIQLVGENPKTTIIDGGTANTTYSPTVEIYGKDAKNVKILNFTLSGSKNAWGIYILFPDSSGAWIENNIITNNSGGIIADEASSNTFINNTITDNKFEGMEFEDSHGNTMKNNTLTGNRYNFGLLGSAFDHNIDTSNTVNGKPICYLKNQTDLTINPTTCPDAGYLALINCTNITVENLTLQNNVNGLLLAGTRNSTLRNNSLRSNERGLDLINSFDNAIEANDIKDNIWRSVYLTTPLTTSSYQTT